MHIFLAASEPPMLGTATDSPWLGARTWCGKTVGYSSTVTAHNPTGGANCAECWSVFNARDK